MGKDVYPTTDTPLATWLQQQGFELLDVNFSNPDSVVLLFKNDSQELNNAVLQWQAGEATGNICIWYDLNRKLVKRIKRGF